jgi:Starch-binding associating with outer membrane
MNLKGFLKYSVVAGALMLPFASCQKFLDVNTDPNAVQQAPIEQLFTSSTASLGFFAGSDLHRYSALLTQQLSGQGAGASTQTQEYERYNIAGSDLNNAWNLAYSTVLSDLELVIQKASKENCAHYGGCAKIMKAYTFSLLADGWGMIPFTDALKFGENLNPKFDDASTVYPALIAMIDAGIADIKATSLKSPNTNSTIFSGAWSASQPRWEAFANALKMRLWLHTIKVDKAKALAAMTTLSAGTLMTSTADNFQMPFLNVSRQQNPIHQFELDRVNYLFSNATMVDMMNAKVDPRRPRYFISYPIYSGLYKGAKGGDAASINYSRMHIYLRGDTTAAATVPAGGTSGNYTYNGTAPIRMLTYAELQFIRAEAALLNGGMLGTIAADSFFRSGIRASMSQAGVTAAAAEAYINATTGGVGNGVLTGTDDAKIKKIIEEKFVANYGVVMEPWSDWRRTGYPTITKPINALGAAIPRSLFYPQSEIDLNPNAPKQKADMSVRVFWDK